MTMTNHTFYPSGEDMNLGANKPYWPSAIVLNFSEGKLIKNSLLEIDALGPAIDVDYSDLGAQITINKSLSQVIVLSHRQAPSIKIKLAPKACAHVLHYFGQHDKSNETTKNSLRLDLESSSRLHYYLLFSDAFLGNHTLKLDAQLQTNACLNFFELAMHKGEINSDSTIDLNSKNARIHYCALNALTAKAKHSSLLKILHNAPDTNSEQIFRGIYGDHADGHFLGKVTIHSSACQSSARQHYKTILLDSNAKAHVMPQLEVNNNDISASHGASIGELDADSLFYLRSRGINEIEAKTMLVTSLSSQIIDEIEDVKIKSFLERQVNAAIKQALEAPL